MYYWDQIYSQQMQVPSCPGGTLYTIQRGDTMYLIAKRYNLCLEELIRVNPQVADPSLIFPGQIICLPVAPIAPTPPVVPVPPSPPVKKDYCKIDMVLSDIGVEKCIAAAMAFISFDKCEVYFTGIKMPPPYKLGREFCSYKAWLVCSKTSSRIRIDVIRCAEGIYVGKYSGKVDLRSYSEIILTVERTPMVKAPTGPIIAKGAIAHCY